MQISFNPRSAALIALLPLCACSGGGSGGSNIIQPPTGPILGTVEIISASTCPRGAGALPNTTCMHLRIQDLDVPDIEVELRITDADPGSTLRGTLVLGTGSLGTSFYGDESGGNLLLPSLTAEGFRVIQRAWVQGWYTTGGSIRSQSARYATLITWIEENLHPSGAFCVSGNSAGSGEIAYALSSWERGDIIDVALLTSGPPMSRLDYGCESPPSQEWLDLCASLVPARLMECGDIICNIPAGNMLCPLLPSNPMPGELEEDSVMHASAELDYPTTLVHTLFGSLDCSIAVPLGMLYTNAISSQKLVEFVSGAPHLIPSTPEGRAAIFAALINATGGIPAAPVTFTNTHQSSGTEVVVEFRPAH